MGRECRPRGHRAARRTRQGGPGAHNGAVTSTAASTADTSLSRTLSHRQMTMIALGSALGTGLFLGSGAAIGLAGPGVILAYALGSLIAAIVVGAMGEMASRYPVQGGFGALASAFLSPFFGYVARWLYWVVTVFVSANELVAVSTYLTFWWPQLPLWFGIAVFAVALLAVNLFSVKSFGTLEYFLSGVKVLALTVFLLVAALLVVFGLPGEPAAGTANLTAYNGFLPNGWYGVWVCMSVVMFSFGGIELVSVTAAEADDPKRSVRLAARTTMVRLAFFYVLAMTLILCLIPWPEAAQGGEGGLQTSPFVQVFAGLGLPSAAALTNIVVLIAALSAANANIYAGARLIHSLAADRMAPRRLAEVNARHVPVKALLISSIGIVIATYLAATGVANLFLVLVGIIMFAVLMVWILILASYIRYRATVSDRAPFRLLGGRATAVLGIVLVLGVFSTVAVVEDMQRAAMFGVPFLLVLTVAYVLGVRRHVGPVRLDVEVTEDGRTERTGQSVRS